MSVTNFYMGSLRYGPNGKKRKGHAANSVKKIKPAFQPMEICPIKAKLAKQAADLRELERKDFLERLSKVKSDTAKKEPMQYTGDRKLIGIATMHKSNAVPIFADDKQHAIDIARMRR